MEPQEKLEKIFSLNQKIEKTGSQTLVPCLIGPSGCGKSSIVEALGKQLGMPVVRLLLQTMLDIEILGLPRVIDGVTCWTKPEWLLEEPFILFLDELDKVRPDEVGAVLTLLAEKRIRNYFLPEGTLIVAAMQPVDPVQWEGSATFEALQNRLVFIKMQSAGVRKRLHELFGVEASYLQFKDFPIPLPEKLSGRVVEYALRLLQEAEEEVARNILSGCMRPEFLEAVISDFKQNVFTGERLVQALKKDPNLINNLTLPELIEISPLVFEKCRPEIYFKIVERVYLEGSEDESEVLRTKLYEYLEELWEKTPGGPDKEIEVCDGASVEEVAIALNEVCKKIGLEWEKRNGNQ